MRDYCLSKLLLFFVILWTPTTHLYSNTHHRMNSTTEIIIIFPHSSNPDNILIPTRQSVPMIVMKLYIGRR